MKSQLTGQDRAGYFSLEFLVIWVLFKKVIITSVSETSLIDQSVWGRGPYENSKT